jgi:hypothetical protein
VFPSAVGTRQDRNRVRNRVLAPSIKRADEYLVGEGSTPLPERLTLHALRRTSISIRIALGHDVRTIMDEHGQLDPAVTVGMYAKAMRPEDKAAWRRFVGLDANTEPETVAQLA